MTLKKDIETSVHEFLRTYDITELDLVDEKRCYMWANKLTNEAVLPALKHHAEDPEGMLCDDPSDNPTVVNIDELFEE